MRTNSLEADRTDCFKGDRALQLFLGFEIDDGDATILPGILVGVGSDLRNTDDLFSLPGDRSAKSPFSSIACASAAGRCHAIRVAFVG
jgi:hypothetical protein